MPANESRAGRAFPGLALVIIESGGDNLTAVFSRSQSLVDTPGAPAATGWVRAPVPA